MLEFLPLLLLFYFFDSLVGFDGAVLESEHKLTSSHLSAELEQLILNMPMRDQ